ncbi:MAG: hypothetical protein JO360_01200 [Acidobacteria bacterium]|nr:hypothetical protein [Acidobacteriota bacterium]
MRHLILLSSLILLLFGGAAQTLAKDDAVLLEKKTVVLVRPKKLTKDFPERRTAKVSYPLVKGGLSNPAVLNRVRALLQVKSIFDSSLEEYRQDTWLEEFDYTVNYNRNYILDITFIELGSGAYPDSQHKHLAINLKTGKLIKASDIFKPAMMHELAAKVNEKLQAEIQENLKEIATNNDYNAEEKQSLPSLYENLKIETKDLNEFSIGEKGITFLYDAGFAHVVQALQPVGEYFFSYAELAPYLQRKGSAASLIP